MRDCDILKTPALIEMPDPEAMGPTWKALTEKQRRFINFYLTLNLQDDRSRAAKLAGYGSERTTAAGYAQLAYQVFHNPEVQAALREATKTIMSSESARCAKALVHIALTANKDADRLKAIGMVLDRTGFHDVTETHVKTEDVTKPRETLLLELQALLDRNPHFKQLVPANLLFPDESKVIDTVPVYVREELTDAEMRELME